MSGALDDAPAESGSVDPKIPQLELDSKALKRRWAAEISRYERKSQMFEKRGKLVIERYIAEKKDDNASRLSTFNLLWSNIQTLKPALYSKDPTPEVDRKFKDKDPIGRTASEVLERALVNVLTQQKFGASIRQAVLDRLLPGRGVVWIRYLPHFAKVPAADPLAISQDGATPKPGAIPPTPAVGALAPAGSKADGAGLTDDAPEDVEEVISEETKFDFVPWVDFGHTVARTWEEVDACWRISYLDRVELEKRFGKTELTAKVQYDQRPEGLEKDSDGQEQSKAKVYEIWDRRTKRVIRLNRGVDDLLEAPQDDPLQLDGFWPFPQPLQASTSSASIIPTADYILWRDQARELDRLSQRITSLTRSLKVVGVHDSGVQALSTLLSGGGENILVSVDSWAAFAEKGGLKGAVELLDVSYVADILKGLYEAREHVKQDIYEISGMSDLLRGVSDPEETAAAQETKAGYVNVRLKDLQREVQEFARDAIKIAAEIICGQFSIESIAELSGINLLRAAEKQQIVVQMQAQQAYQQRTQQVLQMHQQAMAQMQPPAQPGQPPQAPQPAFDPATVLGPAPSPPDPDKLALMKKPTWEDVVSLLRDRPARNFRIDIETDSTIMQDERAEQASRIEFAKVVDTLIQGAMGVVQNVPQLAPAIAETVMLVLRSFKVGRQTEAAYQTAMDELAAMAAHPPQKPPDPRVAAEQAKQQSAQAMQAAKTQGDIQVENAKIDMQERLAQFQATMDAQVEKAKADAEVQRQNAESAAETARAEAQARLDQQAEMFKQHMQAQSDERDRQFNLLMKRLDLANKIEVAEIAADTTIDAAKISGARAASEGGG